MMGRGAPFYSPFHSAVWGSAFGSNSASAAAAASAACNAKASYNGGSPNGGNNNSSSGGSSNNNNNFAYPPTPPKDSSTPDQQVRLYQICIAMNGFILNCLIQIMIFSFSYFVRIISITNLRLMKTTNQLQVEKSIMVWTRIITVVVVEGLVQVTVTETISTHPPCRLQRSNHHRMSWWAPSAINYQVMEEFRPVAARV